MFMETTHVYNTQRLLWRPFPGFLTRTQSDLKLHTARRRDDQHKRLGTYFTPYKPNVNKLRFTTDWKFDGTPLCPTRVVSIKVYDLKLIWLKYVIKWALYVLSYLQERYKDNAYFVIICKIDINNFINKSVTDMIYFQVQGCKNLMFESGNPAMFDSDVRSTKDFYQHSQIVEADNQTSSFGIKLS